MSLYSHTEGVFVDVVIYYRCVIGSVAIPGAYAGSILSPLVCVESIVAFWVHCRPNINHRFSDINVFRSFRQSNGLCRYCHAVGCNIVMWRRYINTFLQFVYKRWPGTCCPTSCCFCIQVSSRAWCPYIQCLQHTIGFIVLWSCSRVGKMWHCQRISRSVHHRLSCHRCNRFSRSSIVASHVYPCFDYRSSGCHCRLKMNYTEDHRSIVLQSCHERSVHS